VIVEVDEGEATALASGTVLRHRDTSNGAEGAEELVHIIARRVCAHIGHPDRCLLLLLLLLAFAVAEVRGHVAILLRFILKEILKS
jgi:hypothetical protein